MAVIHEQLSRSVSLASPISRRRVGLASLCFLLVTCSVFAQAPESSVPMATPSPSPNNGAQAPTCTADSSGEPRSTGTIRAIVVDPNGAAVVAATIVLTREGQSANQQALTDDDGQFFFIDIAPGSYHLTITAPDFAGQTVSATVTSGQNCLLPHIVLPVATNVTKVNVELSPIELAQEQLETQEKQRVLGVIPNFYVTYEPNAVPLNTKQKFQLAWKSTIDPVTFAVTGVVAGVEQATDAYSGYGQGAQGYAKRYGASYADLVTGTFIGGAIFPSLLKQDPRYFYKGTGSTRSRFLYAVANSVICKGDNGHWQPNYSLILGSLASGGISNLYYPEKDRNGFGLTVQNTLVGLAETGAINLLQEFVMRKLTPSAMKAPSTP